MAERVQCLPHSPISFSRREYSFRREVTTLFRLVIHYPLLVKANMRRSETRKIRRIALQIPVAECRIFLTAGVHRTERTAVPEPYSQSSVSRLNVTSPARIGVSRIQQSRNLWMTAFNSALLVL